MRLGLAFVKAQHPFTNAECRVTISGFQDLEDPVLLAHGIMTVLIHHLLLSIPLTSKRDTKLFHGVDCQPKANLEFLIARILGEFPNKRCL